jgi:hypothetical protein
MELAKCSICGNQIMPSDTVFRVSVDEVSSNDGEVEPSYFSKVENWNVCAIFHKRCATIALSGGKDFEYNEEIRSLGFVPRLRVVV